MIKQSTSRNKVQTQYTQPPMQWIVTFLSSCAKQPEREAVSPNAEVKSVWRFFFIPPCLFLTQCLHVGLNYSYYNYCCCTFRNFSQINWSVVCSV